MEFTWKKIAIIGMVICSIFMIICLIALIWIATKDTAPFWFKVIVTDILFGLVFLAIAGITEDDNRVLFTWKRQDETERP